MLFLNIPKPDMQIDPSQISELPKNLRGVYLLYSEISLLYIGKSNDLKSRLGTHVRRTPIYKKECSRIEIYIIESQVDMDIYETYFINIMKPIYNKDKVFKDTDLGDANRELYEGANLYNLKQSNRYKEMLMSLNKANENLLIRLKSVQINSLSEIESILNTEPYKQYRQLFEEIKSLRHVIKELIENEKILESKIATFHRMKNLNPDKFNKNLMLEYKKQETLLTIRLVELDLKEFEIEDIKKELEIMVQKQSDLQLINDRTQRELNETQKNLEQTLLSHKNKLSDLQKSREKIEKLENELSIIKNHWFYRFIERLSSLRFFNAKQRLINKESS